MAVQKLLFTETLDHPLNRIAASSNWNSKPTCDAIKFVHPIIITEIRIVPQGISAQVDGSAVRGNTSPSHFKLDVYCNDVIKGRLLDTCIKFGTLDYSEDETIRMSCPHPSIVSNIIFLRGDYQRMTLCIYGYDDPFGDLDEKLDLGKGPEASFHRDSATELSAELPARPGTKRSRNEGEEEAHEAKKQSKLEESNKDQPEIPIPEDEIGGGEASSEESEHPSDDENQEPVELPGFCGHYVPVRGKIEIPEMILTPPTSLVLTMTERFKRSNPHVRMISTDNPLDKDTGISLDLARESGMRFQSLLSQNSIISPDSPMESTIREQWVAAMEDGLEHAIPGLALLLSEDSETSKGLCEQICNWTVATLVKSTEYDGVLGLRQLKVGLLYLTVIFSSHSWLASRLIEKGAQEALYNRLEDSDLPSNITQRILIALDASLECVEGQERFVGFDEEIDQESAFKKVVSMLLVSRPVRIINSALALLHKARLYSSLARLQDLADRILDIDTGTEVEFSEVVEKIRAARSAFGSLHSVIQPEAGEFVLESLKSDNVKLGENERSIGCSQMLFVAMASRRTLESLAVIMTGVEDVVSSGALDFAGEVVSLLLSTSSGVAFLASHKAISEHLIDVLLTAGNTTESGDIDVSGLLPLSMYSLPGLEKNRAFCPPQELGLHMMYFLSAIKAVDGLLSLNLDEVSVEQAITDPVFEPLHTLLALSNSLAGRSAVANMIVKLDALNHIIKNLEVALANSALNKGGTGKSASKATPLANILANIVLVVLQDESSTSAVRENSKALADLNLSGYRDTVFDELSAWCLALKSGSSSLQTLTNNIMMCLSGKQPSSCESVTMLPPITMGFRLILDIVKHDTGALSVFCLHGTGYVATTTLKFITQALKPMERSPQALASLLDCIGPLLQLFQFMTESIPIMEMFQGHQDTFTGLLDLYVILGSLCRADLGDYEDGSNNKLGSLVMLVSFLRDSIEDVYKTLIKVELPEEISMSSETVQAIMANVHIPAMRTLVKHCTAYPINFLPGLRMLEICLGHALNRDLDDGEFEGDNTETNNKNTDKLEARSKKLAKAVVYESRVELRILFTELLRSGSALVMSSLCRIAALLSACSIELVSFSLENIFGVLRDAAIMLSGDARKSRDHTSVRQLMVHDDIEVFRNSTLRAFRRQLLEADPNGGKSSTNVGSKEQIIEDGKRCACIFVSALSELEEEGSKTTNENEDHGEKRKSPTVGSWLDAMPSVLVLAASLGQEKAIGGMLDSFCAVLESGRESLIGGWKTEPLLAVHASVAVSSNTKVESFVVVRLLRTLCDVIGDCSMSVFLQLDPVWHGFPLAVAVGCINARLKGMESCREPVIGAMLLVLLKVFVRMQETTEIRSMSSVDAVKKVFGYDGEKHPGPLPKFFEQATDSVNQQEDSSNKDILLQVLGFLSTQIGIGATETKDSGSVSVSNLVERLGQAMEDMQTQLEEAGKKDVSEDSLEDLVGTISMDTEEYDLEGLCESVCPDAYARLGNKKPVETAVAVGSKFRNKRQYNVLRTKGFVTNMENRDSRFSQRKDGFRATYKEGSSRAPSMHVDDFMALELSKREPPSNGQRPSSGGKSNPSHNTGPKSGNNNKVGSNSHSNNMHNARPPPRRRVVMNPGRAEERGPPPNNSVDRRTPGYRGGYNRFRNRLGAPPRGGMQNRHPSYGRNPYQGKLCLVKLCRILTCLCRTTVQSYP
eukprot:m.170321 g.170321  ORF g.170321 m.170321 type:complete len:1720 (+) comp15336_c0_seq9:109-5268(+)